MRQKTLLWHIFSVNIVITLTAMSVVGWYCSHNFREFYINQCRRQLENQAVALLPEIKRLTISPPPSPQKIKTDIMGLYDTRYTVIDRKGNVLADNSGNPPDMDNHAGRPEIIPALNGKTGWSMRFSDTLHKNMLYVAIPVPHTREISGGDAAPAVLRLALPVTDIDEALKALSLKIVMGAMFIVALVAMATLWISNHITQPLAYMKEAAERFARGDLSRKLDISRISGMTTELAGLAKSLNTMAVQLAERIESAEKQHNQLNAVFSSMVEPVFALDINGKILNLNRAASRLFETMTDKVSGRQIDEIIRNPSLHKLIDEARRKGEIRHGEIEITHNGPTRHFHASIMPLKNSSNAAIGILVVMNDITRLKRLENVRSDFVANVSHELKTPVTSIKGYVEALMDGALDEPETAEKFLGIVNRQANRLNAIIEDLLALSRIEQDKENATIDFMNWKITDLFDAVIQTCSLRGQEKDITFHVACPDYIEAQINPALMEQAVVNLVVNAIKYSKRGSKVIIKAENFFEEGTDLIRISVQDFGTGIAAHHLPRLFERFYRSDKARSRKLGGTGLGLAIVKHIADAHGGKITVTSELDKGTTFFLYIPVSHNC